MEGPEAVQRATELIEQRLAQEEETEVRAEVKGAPVKGRELQVKESTCTAVGRERLTAMWVHNMLNRYFLPPPGLFPHQDDPDGVVGGERWGLEVADLPKTLPNSPDFRR